MKTRFSNVMVAAAAVAALTLTTSMAAAQDVGYNAMPGVDFSKFKTYKWITIKDAQVTDQITDAQIKAAIDAELAAKGLKPVETGQVDLLVGYQVALDKEKQWNAYSMGGPSWGWGPGYHGYGYGGGSATATSSTIVVGTMGLDFYDPQKQQLVWRGTASKTLDPKAKPEKRQKNMAKAMKKLLKNFPPPVKK